MVQRYGHEQCQMLAHKVETRQQFLTAQKEGFTRFQGYFFRHPESLQARQIPANQATCRAAAELRSQNPESTLPRSKRSSSTNLRCATGCCAI